MKYLVVCLFNLYAFLTLDLPRAEFFENPLKSVQRVYDKVQMDKATLCIAIPVLGTKNSFCMGNCH